MPLSSEDTIAAVASAPGAGARGIVRVSGADTVQLVSRLVDAPVPDAGSPKRMNTRVLSDSIGSPLPADVLVWPGTRSYTGQPMAEFHVIGAPPVLELLLAAVLEQGARPAERGEFTMRAFLSGRIDLLQAEAVLGVIDAADHEELQSALTQLGGGLTQQLREIRSSIIGILGDLEAGLDFVEEDIEFISSDEMIRRLTDGRHILQRLLQESRDRLPSGYRPRVVLAGLPNAGKSTLFNCLANADLAIASRTAGTTRDYLSSPVSVGDVTFDLIDTAGWDTTTDDIMTAAILLRHQQLHAADLVLWCTAADLSAEQRQADQQQLAEAESSTQQLVRLTTCVDRVPDVSVPPEVTAVSATTGEGLEDVRSRIVAALTAAQSGRHELLATTSARCRDSLRRAIRRLDAAVESAEQNLGDEITAISLRETLGELRAMLGETWTDDILDHIFSSFCIGK